MSRIPDHVIDTIRDRIDLTDFIGKYVSLKNKGKDPYGKCPFCKDNSRHFSIAKKKGFFHCFLCGANGDAIGFMVQRGMPFREAVAEVGMACGVDIDVETFAPSGYDPELRARERAREVEVSKQEQDAAWDAVAKKLAVRFDRAEPARLDFKYLKDKGITSAPGLRQEGSTLLVPMRAVESAKPLLMSLQAISPDGNKRFAGGGRVQGTRTVVGAEGFRKRLKTEDHPILYICEGWATGWTIWYVTGDPAIVAFSGGNLKAIAVATAARYPTARIIIAADNDAWTEIPQGKNPGLIFAREAAEAAGCEYAVPDFGELEPGDRPTDFNDLWQREGAEMVKRWLDPHQASNAVTVIEGAPVDLPARPNEPASEGEDVPTDVPTVVEEARATWIDSADFYPIGYNGDRYYYMPRRKGQIASFTFGQHKAEAFLSLAPLSWWTQTFKGENGVSWNVAKDAMFRACEKVGVFRPERLRGRGCWMDDEGVVLHLGSALLGPESGTWVDPETYRGGGDHIYERKLRLHGPSKKRELGIREAGEVLALFRDLLWIDGVSGDLLAGWTVLAPLSGALSWRPHVWLTGSPGAGKSEILKELVVPLLGGTKERAGMASFYEGGSTEAGIRQEMGASALPIVYDEAEKDKTGGKQDTTMQGVVALARSASSASGSSVVKGSSHGDSSSYQVWSMFCLSSVSSGLRQEQDKSRVSVLQLHGAASIAKSVRADHWQQYQPRLANVSITMGRELFARTLGWLRDGRLATTIKIFKAAAASELGNTRAGDQYGTLYAGMWTLLSDTPPDPEVARELIRSGQVVTNVNEQLAEGHKVLEALLQSGARLEFDSGPAHTYAVGELVDAVRPGTVSKIVNEATAWLNRHGMLVELMDGEPVLYIANRSKWVEQALRDTPFGDDWRDALRSVEGVVVGGPTMNFHAGLTSRVVIIPLSLLERRTNDA